MGATEHGAGIGAELAPCRDRPIPHLARGRIPATFEVSEGRLVGRDEPAHRRELGSHVAQGEAALDVERFDRRSGELDRVPLAAACTVGRDERQHQVLGRDAGLERAVEGDAHRSGPGQAQRARRERMLRLGRADAPGERAERALRAGMAVGADQRRAGQHDAELGRDDVNDALVGVVHVEQLDARRAAFLAGGRQKGLAARNQRSPPAGAGIDDMVGDREHPRGVEHPPPGRSQAPKRDRSGALVKEHPVDRDQVVAADRGDDMAVPQLGEEGLSSRQAPSPVPPHASRG
jgi:hypothetical protein